MKALGAEIQEFYSSGFPEGYYHDDYDESLFPDMDVKFEPSLKYDLSRLGYLEPETRENEKRRLTFSSAFMRWRKSKGTVSVVIECPSDRKDELMRLLKTSGF